jgi:hypothetical protein
MTTNKSKRGRWCIVIAGGLFGLCFCSLLSVTFMNNLVDSESEVQPTSQTEVSPLPTPTSQVETPTKLPASATPSPTLIPTQTIEPPTPIAAIVDVPNLLGKPINEVETILGAPTLITPNDDADDKLAGGEYRDYQIGKYVAFVAYDKNGLARVFQVLEGLSDENYSINQWEEILPVFGIIIFKNPDREAPAALYWDDYNGLLVAVVASSARGKPVWSVQIAEVEFKP